MEKLFTAVLEQQLIREKKKTPADSAPRTEKKVIEATANRVLNNHLFLIVEQ